MYHRLFNFKHKVIKERGNGMLRELTSCAPSYIPLMFEEFLTAELRIIKLKGLSVHSKAARVRIDRINVNGLRFSTELCFPVNPLIILNFSVVILNEIIDLKGTIHWSLYENNIHLYEVNFIKDDQTKAKLITLLNSLTRQYMPLQLRVGYYEKYYSESAYEINNSRINYLM
jgi:hypothetical protein